VLRPIVGRVQFSSSRSLSLPSMSYRDSLHVGHALILHLSSQDLALHVPSEATGA